MKLRDLRYLLGRRPTPQTFGHEIVTFELPKDGIIRYAQWLHPRETRKTISQQAVDELRTFLSPGDVAVDIGAHSGDSSLPIALAVGPTGCVLAFEPNQYVFPVLEATAACNPEKTRIVPLMFAATPENRDYEFEYSDPGFCNGGPYEGISRWYRGHVFPLRVHGRNLQALLNRDYSELLPRIRFLKVDTEGYDHAVLRTLERLIAERRPCIRAEIFKWTNRDQRAAFFAFLAGHGYSVHRIESDSHYRGERISEADLMRWRQFDIFCVPGG